MRARVLLLFVALPSMSQAQYIIGARDTFTARVDSVFRPYDRTDAPGCAVGVYRDGRIVYARGYGMANLELGVPITPRSGSMVPSAFSVTSPRSSPVAAHSLIRQSVPMLDALDRSA